MNFIGDFINSAFGIYLMDDFKLKSKVVELLKHLKLIQQSNEVLYLNPLSGGIASDVLEVGTKQGSFCLKFAIPKLRVEADWFAPVHRNRSEYQWLKIAEEVIPQNAPKLFGYSEIHNGFVMEYLGGEDCFMWKSKLLEQPPDLSIAKQVAEILAKVQSISAMKNFDRSQFDTKDVFWHMRIDPYINYTGSQHPALTSRFNKAAKDLANASIALVHGDVSPKNVMVKGSKAVLIDADCASMGDPAFDIAFCLNHFFLKGLHKPVNKEKFYQVSLSYFRTYNDFVDWEPKSELDNRTAFYLPLLGLARVDGKSPVEYLSPNQKEFVRGVVIPMINEPQKSTEQLLKIMFQQIV